MKRQEPKVYLTTEQLALIDRAAERLDISRSQFMRQAAVEKATNIEDEYEKRAYFLGTLH